MCFTSPDRVFFGTSDCETKGFRGFCARGRQGHGGRAGRGGGPPGVRDKAGHDRVLLNGDCETKGFRGFVCAAGKDMVGALGAEVDRLVPR